MSEILTVKNMNVEFSTRDGKVRAVRDVSFSLAKGEILGIVGESGSGKSVTSYAIMKILDRAGRLASGAVRYSGIDLISASESEMRDIRGREISMIFQNARSALNPIRKIGLQIEDVLKQHAQAVGAEAKEKAIQLLRQVRIRDPEQRYHAYPFELSGGMCQRVGIALAIACHPQLLIADEPTTGLDVTTQKTVMDLVVEITRDRGLATILITHDLGLASTYCDRIMVMQGGSVVESSDTRSLFENASDPYTRRLIAATPRVGGSIRDLLGEENGGAADTRKPSRDGRAHEDTAATPSADPVLRVENLVKEYPIHDAGAVSWLSKFRASESAAVKPRTFRAVDDISFQIAEGESVGLVGESGCGKSTTSAMIMRLLDQTSGNIRLDSEEISQIPAKAFSAHPLRPALQMVFQDPTDSLNPRFTAARSISDPIRQIGSREAKQRVRDRVEEIADLVGLPADLLNRFPHQLSGGQKARVGIARAMALNPRLLVLDEPTAALDVSVQAVVLNLLVDLRNTFGMSYLFVSHDINVVRLLCDRVIVMKEGKIVETGRTKAVMESPVTDYVRELVEAVPQIRF